MSVAVDLELKKAFSEMQTKMVDSRQKMRLADLQVWVSSMVSSHAEGISPFFDVLFWEGIFENAPCFKGNKCIRVASDNKGIFPFCGLP